MSLNPATIEGSVQVAGQSVDSASISAFWTDPASGIDYSASTSISGSGHYSLTVNVPEGSTPRYAVRATLSLNGSRSWLYLPPRTVGVVASQTSIADFEVDPILLDATVNSTGGTMTSIELLAIGVDGARAYGSTTGALLQLPVFPCASSRCIQVMGYAHYASGASVRLDEQYLAGSAGQRVALAWNVSPPTSPGAVAGVVTMLGAPTGHHVVQASGPLDFRQATRDGDGPYSLANLSPGRYQMRAFSSFDAPFSFLYHPDASFSTGRWADVFGGTTTNVDVTASAATLEGRLTLRGPKDMPRPKSLSLTAAGVPQTGSAGGFAITNADVQSGSYRLVVTEGSWALASLGMAFQDPNPASYLFENIGLSDSRNIDNPVVVGAGESATRDLSYGMGLVRVTLSGSGTLLSSPYVQGSCVQRDSNGVLQWSYGLYASGNQVDVSQASVSFVGVEGTCSLEAFAQVGGSYVKFGNVGVTVLAGTTVVVGLSSPVLHVTSPEADLVTSSASIDVTGTAEDDDGVVSLTVNGQPATLTSGGFSASVALGVGPNPIVTVATDAAGNTTSDTRIVHREAPPPPVDTTPPVITPRVAGTAGAAGWYVSDVVVDWSVADPESGITASSGCGATLVDADTAGVSVTCVATSAGGSASQSVTIRRDATPPVIAGLPGADCSLWPANHALLKVAAPTATDALSGVNGGLVLSVTSNEPTLGPDDQTTPDWLIGGEGDLRLRAERAGGGSGRTYSIVATASDVAGNVKSASAGCVVPHDLGK